MFDNISRYAAVIPGVNFHRYPCSLTVTQNNLADSLYDVVVVDEIQKIQTDTSGEAMAALKCILKVAVIEELRDMAPLNLAL